MPHKAHWVAAEGEVAACFEHYDGAGEQAWLQKALGELRKLLWCCGIFWQPGESIATFPDTRIMAVPETMIIEIQPRLRRWWNYTCWRALKNPATADSASRPWRRHLMQWTRTPGKYYHARELARLIEVAEQGAGYTNLNEEIDLISEIGPDLFPHVRWVDEEPGWQGVVFLEDRREFENQLQEFWQLYSALIGGLLYPLHVARDLAKHRAWHFNALYKKYEKEKEGLSSFDKPLTDFFFHESRQRESWDDARLAEWEAWIADGPPWQPPWRAELKRIARALEACGVVLDPAHPGTVHCPAGTPIDPALEDAIRTLLAGFRAWHGERYYGQVEAFVEDTRQKAARWRVAGRWETAAEAERLALRSLAMERPLPEPLAWLDTRADGGVVARDAAPGEVTDLSPDAAYLSLVHLMMSWRRAASTERESTHQESS